ncbi:MAG: M48 family metallopeptidase [Phycisphaerales bacterium]
MTNPAPAPPPPPPSQSREAAGAVHLERPAIHAYPANVTYGNLTAENRRKSAILVVIMFLFAVAVGAAAGVLLGGASHSGDVVGAAISGAIAFGVFATIASGWSWFSGSNAILSMAGAQPIQKSDDPQLFNVVEELSIAAGLPMPKVYLIADDSLNAFATGRDPANAAIAITTGLRASLTRDELAGVMAHEMSHVRHYDIRLMMLLATMAGLIVFVADLTRRMRFINAVSGGRRNNRSDRQGGNPLAIVLVLLSVVVLIIAPIVATLIRLAISRQREYLADAGAVELTRYPQGLVDALKKLGACRTPLQRQNEAIAPLFIVNPKANAVEEGRQNVSSVFLTHPPLSDRIARLEALM